MHISSVTIEGFGSFKKSQTIRFNHKSIIALVGQNGAGKSTILQAIAFVLCRSNNFDTSIITGDDDRANVSVMMCNEAEDSVQLGRELHKDNKEFFFIENIRTKKHYYEYILYSMGFINDTSFFLLDTKCLEYFTMASENDLCSLTLQFCGIGDIVCRSNDSNISEKVIANTKESISTQLSLQKHEHEHILKQVQNFSDYERAIGKKERFELYLKGFTKMTSLLQLLSDDVGIMKLRGFADDHEKRIKTLKWVKQDTITGLLLNEVSKSDLNECNEITSYMQSGLFVPNQSDVSIDTSRDQDMNSHKEEAVEKESYHDKEAQLIYEWCIEVFEDTELGRMFSPYDNTDHIYLDNLNQALLILAHEKVDVVNALLRKEYVEQRKRCIEPNRLQTCDNPDEQQQSLDEQHKGLDEQQQGLDEQQQGLDEQHKGLDEQQQGLDEQHKGLDEQQQGLDEQQQGLDEQQQGLDEQQQGLVEQQQGLDEQQQGLDEQQQGLDEQISTIDQKSLMCYQNLIDHLEIAFKPLAKSFYPVLGFVKENEINHKDYLGPLALLINTDLSPRLHSIAVRLHPEYMFAHVVSSSRIADRIISGLSDTDRYQAEDFELSFIILNETSQDLREYERVSRFTKQANNKIMKEAQRDGCEVLDTLSVPNNLSEVPITLNENARYRYLVEPLLKYFKTSVSKLKYVYQKLFGEYAVSFDRNELVRINKTRHIPGITLDGRELINSKTIFYEYSSRFELIAVVNLHNIVISLLCDEKMQSTDSSIMDSHVGKTTSDEEIRCEYIASLKKELKFLERVKRNLAHNKIRNFYEIVLDLRYDLWSNTYMSRWGKIYALKRLTDTTDISGTDDKPLDPCDAVSCIGDKPRDPCDSVSCTNDEPLDPSDDIMITQNSSLNDDEALNANTDSPNGEESAHEKILRVNLDIRNEESKHLKIMSRIGKINEILMECKSLDAAIQRQRSEIEDQCSQKWKQCCDFIFTLNELDDSQHIEKVSDITRSAMEGLRFTTEAFEDIKVQLERLKGFIDTEFPGHSTLYHQDLYERYLFRLDSINEYLKSDWMVNYANMELVQSIKSRKEIFFAKLQSKFEIIFVKLTGVAGSLRLKRNAEDEIVGISFDVGSEEVIGIVDLPIVSINQLNETNAYAYGTPYIQRGARYRKSSSRQRNKRKRITRRKFMRYLPPMLKEKLVDNVVNKGIEKQFDNKQGQNQDYSKEHSVLNSADDILEKENVEEINIHEEPELAGSNDIFPDDSSDRDYEPYSDNHSGHGKGNNIIKRRELIDLPDVSDSRNPSTIALSYEQKRAACLALLLSLHVNHSFKVFLLDEIDAELDPTLRVRLANTIKELSVTYKNQYIISTHFRTILNLADKFYNVSRTRYSGGNGATSVVQRISKEGALIMNKDEGLTTLQRNYDFFNF